MKAYSKTKPFPSGVNWLAFWKHRWIIMDFINQVAHGDQFTAVCVMYSYGGSTLIGVALKEAADAIIVKGRIR